MKGGKIMENEGLYSFEILDNAVYNLETAIKKKEWLFVKIALEQVNTAFKMIMEED